MDPSNGYNGKIHPEVNNGPPQQQQPMGYANQGAQQSSSQTTVIIQQPVQQRSQWVPNVKGHRDWTSGACDCFSDMGVCKFSLEIYSSSSKNLTRFMIILQKNNSWKTTKSYLLLACP
jgi:hypothetical protein